DVEITRKAFLAVNERIRRIGILAARFHPGQRVAIDSRMAAEQRHRLLLPGKIDRALQCSKGLTVGRGKSSARHEGCVLLSAVSDREKQGDRAGCMAGRVKHCHRRVTQYECLSIGNGDIAHGQFPVPLRRSRDEIPVGARHQYLWFIRALEIRGSAKMVEMAVADDDVLNLLRIQTRFLHSWYEDLFAFFRRVQGVNNNDSPARCKRDGQRSSENKSGY